MKESIKGFSHVEYLAVFLALVFAFVVAEFFIGWGSMLKRKGKYKPYWEHTVWTIVFFTALLINWFAIWPRLEYIDKNMLVFVLLLIPALVFYLMGNFVFPRLKKQLNLREYLDEKSSIIFGLLAFYFLLQMGTDYVLGEEKELFVTIFRSVLILWSGIIAFTSNSFLRKIFLLVVVLMIGYSFSQV